MRKLRKAVRGQNEGAIEGYSFSFADTVLLETAKDSYRSSGTEQNQYLRSIFTVSAALAGGNAILASNPSAFSLAGLILFALAAAASFIGARPYSRSVDMNSMTDLRSFMKSAFNRKNKYIIISGVLTGGGIICYAANVFMKVIA